MAKMIEMNARGVVEVNKYGLLVDGESLLEELLKHFKEYNEFAGSVHILVTDDTEPLEVLVGENPDEMLSYHMGEIPESVQNAIMEIILGGRPEEPEKEGNCHESSDDNE